MLPALTSAIFNTCGVWVYILSILFLKEVVDLRKIISLVIGIAGVVAILFSSIEDVPDNSSAVRQQLCFLSAFVFRFALPSFSMTNWWAMLNAFFFFFFLCVA